MKYASIILLNWTFFVNISSAQNSGSVPISPEFQETPEWCWVTSSSMVLRYLEVPTVNPGGNYQCGLIGWFFGPQSSCYYNCFTCPVPARGLNDIRTLFNAYPSAAGILVEGRPIRIRFYTSSIPLSKSLIRNTIDHGSPILTGVSPSGFFRGISEHVTVIVGYEETGDGNLVLRVNDPFPYHAAVFSTENPYLRAGGTDNNDGSYEIGYNEYIQYLQWHETLYQFERLY